MRDGNSNDEVTQKNEDDATKLRDQIEQLQQINANQAQTIANQAQTIAHLHNTTKPTPRMIYTSEPFLDRNGGEPTVMKYD